MMERDLTCKALAHRTRITPRTLSHLANNKIVKFDVTILARLCQVLGCQVGELLQWVPDGNELAKKLKPRGIPAHPMPPYGAVEPTQRHMPEEGENHR